MAYVRFISKLLRNKPLMSRFTYLELHLQKDLGKSPRFFFFVENN